MLNDGAYSGTDLKSFSLGPYSSRIISFIMDGEGRILEMESGLVKKRNPSIARALLQTGNIFDWFDLSPYTNVGDIPFEARDQESAFHRAFHNKRPIHRIEDADPFYTSLPTVDLVIRPLSENRFRGSVYPLDTVPNIGLETYRCLVYADDQDRLVGFNDSFFRIFSDGTAKPDSFFRRPLQEFFAPTPMQIQRDNLKRIGLSPPDNLRQKFALVFTDPGDAALLEFSDPASWQMSGEGLRWTGTAEGLSTFTVPVPLKADDDFQFTLEAEPLEGGLPVFMLGAEIGAALPKSPEWPDQEGYLVGPNPRNDGILVKKRGMTVRREPVPPDVRGSRFRFTRKAGGLWLTLDNRRLTAFYDDDFDPEKRWILRVGLRAGSAFLLKSLRLEVSALPSPSPSPAPTVRLTTREREFMLLNRVFGTMLSVSHPDVSAYVLVKVTEMQRQLETLREENRRLLADAGGEREFIGRNPAIAAIKKNAAVVARSNTTILIQGETGTGKEQLAHYIRDLSPRKAGPFIKVDCSTLPQGLIESELFGHEKGAFTGADSARAGHLETAHQGTLFLDEIGNLSLETQAKLLHFLQDHSLTRVGGRKSVIVDVRIIAATNRPLAELVKKGLFRSDLYYRMDVITVTLPPLRERREDLAEFCRVFLKEFCLRHKKVIEDFTSEAYHKLLSHAWPGNIRELRNTIERAVLFCNAPRIPRELISFSMQAGPVRSYRTERLDMEALKEALRRHNGVIKNAAAELGLPRRTVYYQIKKSGMTAPEIRGNVRG